MTKHKLWHFNIDNLHLGEDANDKFIIADTYEEAKTAFIYQHYIEIAKKEYPNNDPIDLIGYPREVTMDNLLEWAIEEAYFADSGSMTMDTYGVHNLFDIK